MEIKVGVSNRHIHLNKEDLTYLFGDIDLEKRNDLSQTGEFASTLTLTIKTDKGELENVRILGPIRLYTQIEISKTDAYKLGINPPVRSSGETYKSAPITLVGPNGELKLDEGCIIANRHIHLTKQDREKYNLENVDKVKVLVEGEKGGLLDNVYLKENESYVFEFHIDTDDANANLLKTGDSVKIIIPEEY